MQQRSGDWRPPVGSPTGWTTDGRPVWLVYPARWSTWTVAGTESGGWQSDDWYVSSPDEVVTGWQQWPTAEYVWASGEPAAIYHRVIDADQLAAYRATLAQPTEVGVRAATVLADRERVARAARHAEHQALALARHGCDYARCTRRQRDAIAADVDAGEIAPAPIQPAPVSRPASPFAALAALRSGK